MAMPWRSKLRHARNLIGAYDAAAKDYLNSSVQLTRTVNQDQGHVTLCCEQLAEPPDDLGLIIGDALHNMRSALDSIAFKVAVTAGAPRSTYSSIYFPITPSEKDWDRNASRKLPRVLESDLAVFRSLQPWAQEQSVELSIPANSSLRHPLWRLHELAREDRHRTVHPVLTYVPHDWLGLPPGVTAEPQPPTEFAQVPGHIRTWHVHPRDRANDVDPGGDIHLTLELPNTFMSPTPSVTQELGRMHAAVCRAVQRIEIDVLRSITAHQLDELETRRHRAALSEEAYNMACGPHDVWDRETASHTQTLRETRDRDLIAYHQLRNEIFGDY